MFQNVLSLSALATLWHCFSFKKLLQMSYAKQELMHDLSTIHLEPNGWCIKTDKSRCWLWLTSLMWLLSLLPEEDGCHAK